MTLVAVPAVGAEDRRRVAALRILRQAKQPESLPGIGFSTFCILHSLIGPANSLPGRLRIHGGS